MSDLTKRQAELLGLIRSRLLAGKPPTVRDLMNVTGTVSTQGILCHVLALRKKGYLADAAFGESRALRLKANEIEVTRDGSDITVATTGPVKLTPKAWKEWLKAAADIAGRKGK